MVEELLLVLADWQRHLSSPLLSEHLKERVENHNDFEVQRVDQAVTEQGTFLQRCWVIVPI